MKRKSTSLAVLAFSALAAVSSQGAVLYNSSDFSFTDGDIVGQDNWAAHSAAASVPVQVNVAGEITLTQGSGSREDVNVGVTPIAVGQTYYYGFDMVVSGGSTNVYFAHFKDSAFDFTTRLFLTAFTGSDFTLGLSASSSNPDVTWATGLDFGTLYRVIGSYSADDQLTRVWVNPVDESSTSISFTDSAAAAVSAFALRQASGNSTQIVSNVIVATTFNEAAIIPEPTAALLGGLGLLTLLRRRR